MAEATVTIPDYVSQLAQSLERELMHSVVDYEKVRSDRYRFVIIWEKFEGMEHPERQRLVWEIAEVAVAKADLWKVSMIVTLAPSEVAESRLSDAEGS